MDWEAIGNTLWGVLTNGGWLVLKLIGVFVLGYIIIRIIKRIVRNILKKSIMDSLAKKFIMNILSFLLYFVLVLILLQMMGVEITGVLTAFAAAGLAVALALQDALTSLANGVLLVITKPFKENDAIEINGISGRVKSINFFNTVIDTWDNRRIIIPNKNMIGNQIENTNFHSKRRFSIKFLLNESINFNQVKEIVIKAILSNENVFVNPYPEFLLKEIDEKGILVEARGWANSEDCDTVCLKVKETIFNELKRNNIDLENSRVIVHMEERKEEPSFDPTPLPERDLTKEPSLKKGEQQTFDDYLDSITVKKLNKIKILKKQKNKK